MTALPLPLTSPDVPGPRAVAVRALALGGGFVVATAVVAAVSGPTSFAGIWVMAAFAVATAVWAFVDGRRGGQLGLRGWVRCWLAVEAVLTVALAVVLVLQGGLVGLLAAAGVGGFAFVSALLPLIFGSQSAGVR